MRANRHRDTEPELAVRRLVHKSGLRYRVATKPLREVRRTADLVFRPAKVAVFIDGCFWHGCRDHYVEPKANSDYWAPKISRNRERDAETDSMLEQAGWLVIRRWEHDNPELVADEIEKAVRSRRSKATESRPTGLVARPMWDPLDTVHP